jgi:uncharacterized membrane protein
MKAGERGNGEFPILSGILLGLGLGGFFDGIVLHQLLQWHHMLTSAGYPADSVPNLAINTLWDGLFHAGTYLLVLLGLVVLWRRTQGAHVRWSVSGGWNPPVVRRRERREWRSLGGIAACKLSQRCRQRVGARRVGSRC